ncbi:replication protein [Salmonella enterica subsp. enterica serovar Enteritidis]|uniref:replication protein n=2 Tax=Lysinibacillus TaxID=400634 RepID=UPI001CBE0522|nr:replication protein [Lysinibacillus sphaericus]EDW5948283.1 replication protein [Salmonella enterica subsp. enterica serovar Enteritidis]
MTAQKKDERTKTWTFVIYPESAPENWREIIGEEHTPWVESPLHDKDVNADGEVKKPHWHVLMMYNSKKSFNQIKRLTDELNAPIPQPCRNTKGMVRYFVHLDNPEKYQYRKEDIRVYGGADIKQHLTSASEQKNERYDGIREMCKFVDEHGIIEFSDLMAYAMENRADWFELLCDNSAYVIGLYIKSRRHKQSDNAGAKQHLDE